MGQIVLVRHGETPWSATGQHTSVTDLDLTENGTRQAEELGPILANRDFAAIWSSPRKRAVRTAELAGLEITAIRPDLAEWAYGDYEGLTTEQIQRDDPDWTIWTEGGKGPGGEWELKLKDGRPIEIGHYRVANIADEPPRRLYRPYAHAGLFDYNVAVNTWRNLPLRVIRDIVVLPNPGDHSLMLSKAYFQLGFFHIFYCYFLLGRRKEIEYEPW
jgi:hypothetical protein